MDDCAPQKQKQQTGPSHRRQNHAFYWAIFTGGTPCQTCMWHDYCAKNRATCQDWDHYVETGELKERLREPRENTLEN